MMRRLLALALVTIIATAVVGCREHPLPFGPPPPPLTPFYQDLSEAWHVLYNIETAYDERHLGGVEQLLDVDFVFYFFPGDVGGNIPPQWDYAAEIQATTNMFGRAGGINDNPILTIDLTVFDVEGAEWTDVADPGFPGETLRQATVTYDYFIDTIQDRQFITSGAPRARFVVRRVDGKWKLVRWYDLSNGGLRRTTGEAEPTTWGRLKSLYQGRGR